MKSKKAIILISWYSTPKDNWYPWLANELTKKGYEVHVPDLPTIRTDLPSLKKQMACVEKIGIDKDTIMIGHSLGALLAQRLAEKHKYAQMILFAAWDFDDLYPQHRFFWPNKMNHAKINKNVKEMIVFSTNNDPYTTDFQVKEMTKRYRCKYVFVKDAGHFSKKSGNITKLPYLLKYL